MTTGTNPLPPIKVQVGFDSNPLDDPQIWTDVSLYVRDIKIDRGRQHVLSRFEPGRLTLTCLGYDRVLDPFNTSSSLYPNVKVNKQIQVLVSADGGSTFTPLFTGFVDSWKPLWPDNLYSDIEVTATDGLRFLQADGLYGLAAVVSGGTNPPPGGGGTDVDNPLTAVNPTSGSTFSVDDGSYLLGMFTTSSSGMGLEQSGQLRLADTSGVVFFNAQPSGVLVVGNVVMGPNQLSSSELNAPGTGGHVVINGVQLFAGPSGPTGVLANDGDFWFAADGGTGGPPAPAIYQYRSGVWVSIL